MAEDSKIEWCDATFNPWVGCTKVSAGCKNCYAEADFDKRRGFAKWGPNGTRVVTSEANWKKPLKWNKDAAAAGVRKHVFCASLADVFEDWPHQLVVPNGQWATINRHMGQFTGYHGCNLKGGNDALMMQDVRARLFALIEATPQLDWLLLTKRPENVLRMTYDSCCKRVPGHVSQNAGDGYHWQFPPNVWMGTSVENQATADERIPHLLNVPAKVRFLSCEPLLDAVSLTDQPWWDHRSEHAFFKAAFPNARPPIDWVIIGGESGTGARPMQIEWARSLVKQCKAAGVAAFVKQLGSTPEGDKFPENERDPVTGKIQLQVRQVLTIRDRKGGDMSEFPEDLRVREFPTVPA